MERSSYGFPPVPDIEYQSPPPQETGSDSQSPSSSPQIPRKSSRRSKARQWPLSEPSLALTPTPPAYLANEKTYSSHSHVGHESKLSLSAGLFCDADRYSLNKRPSSSSFSDIIKSYSRPMTEYALGSQLPCDDDAERADSSTWLEQQGIGIKSDSEVALTDTQHAIMPAEPPPPTPPSGMSFTYSEMLFIFNVCLAQLLSLAGLAQTFAPLMILSDVFHVRNPGLMAWPTAAYSLTLGSCILPAGRLGDMFGHRRIFLTGWIWFGATSLLVGFSELGGSPMFTATRAFQGIGPALLIPNGLALFGRTFPMGLKRNIAISLFGGSGPIGVVTGAVMSSLLDELVWWPWSFWCMGIVCFLIATLTFVVIPRDDIESDNSEKTNTLAKFDILGALTGVGGLVIVNFALNQAPIDGWTTVYIGLLLGIGVVLLGSFVYIEVHVAESPLIPLKGLHRDAALALSCIAAGWGSHGIWSYYLYLLIEQYRGHSALAACSMFWPVAPIGLAAALSVGFLLKKINVAYLMSISMLCFLLGCLFLATAPGHQGYFPNTFLSIIVAPFGMNWSFPTGVILMSNAVPREHQGIAASLVSTVVNYSISTGLGFAGSIDRYVGHEYGLLAGYRGAWYFGIGLSGLGFLISLYFIWQSRKSKTRKDDSEGAG